MKDQFLENELYISAWEHVMKLILSSICSSSINTYNTSMLSCLIDSVKSRRSISFWSGLFVATCKCTMFFLQQIIFSSNETIRNMLLHENVFVNFKFI